MKEKKFLNQNGVEIEEQIKLSGHKWHVSCLGFSINGVYFASGSWDKQIRIWDLRVLTSSKTLGDDDKGHKAPVTSVSWFPNIEFLLASGSADNTIRIWNSESGERLSLLEGHTEWVLGTSFNYNGTVLSSASWDKNIGMLCLNFDFQLLVNELCSRRFLVAIVRAMMIKCQFDLQILLYSTC